jgi:hypothetical protein
VRILLSKHASKAVLNRQEMFATMRSKGKNVNLQHNDSTFTCTSEKFWRSND